MPAAETAEEPAAEDAATAEAEKEPASTVGYQTFVSVMPAASGGGTRVMGLRLFEDGTLAWDTQFHNGEPPIEEIGTWTENSDGTITATVTGRPDMTYDEPDVVVFQSEDGTLVAVEYDESMYGSEGLELTSVRDVAASVEASLFTLDLAAGFPLDPTFMSVNAGGAVPASLLGAECSGFVNEVPVVTVNWSGQADFVEVFFVSNDDPTLVVIDAGRASPLQRRCRRSPAGSCGRNQQSGRRRLSNLDRQLPRRTSPARHLGSYHEAGSEPGYIQSEQLHPASADAGGSSRARENRGPRQR